MERSEFKERRRRSSDFLHGDYEPTSSKSADGGVSRLLHASSQLAQIPNNPHSVAEAVRNLNELFPHAAKAASQWDYRQHLFDRSDDKRANLNEKTVLPKQILWTSASGIGAALAASGLKSRCISSRNQMGFGFESNASSQDFTVQAIQAAKGLHILTRTIVAEYDISTHKFSSSESDEPSTNQGDQPKVHQTSCPEAIFTCIKATTFYVHVFFMERRIKWKVRRKGDGIFSRNSLDSSVPSPPHMAPGSFTKNDLGIMQKSPGELTIGSPPSILSGATGSRREQARMRKEEEASAATSPYWEEWLAEQEAWWEVWTQAMTAVATLSGYVVNPTLKQKNTNVENKPVSDCIDCPAKQSVNQASRISPALLSEIFQFTAMSSVILPPVLNGEVNILLGDDGEVTCGIKRDPNALYHNRHTFKMFGDFFVTELFIQAHFHATLYRCPPVDVWDGRSITESIWARTWPKLQESLLQNERTWLLQRQEIHQIQGLIVSSLCLLEQDENTSLDELCLSYLDMNGEDKSGVSQMHLYSKSLATVIKSWLQTSLAGWPQSISFERRNSNKDHRHEWSLYLSAGSIDWETNNAMLITDITSNGWLPFHFAHVEMDSTHDEENRLHNATMKDDIEEVVQYLIVLTERGLFNGRKPGSFSDQKVISSEDVTAASCAAESICALAALGDTLGTISRPRFLHLVQRLCYILAAAEYLEVGDDSLRLLDISYHSTDLGLTLPKNQDVWNDDEIQHETTNSVSTYSGKAPLENIELIRAQRNACLLDNAELLWFFLSNQVTSEATVNCLISIISSLSSNCVEDDDRTLSVMGAIRTLGTALFGNPPEVSGISMLRSFWVFALDALSQLSLNLFSDSSTVNLKTALVRDRKRISISLEILVGTRRLLENLLSAASSDDLSPNRPASILLPQEYDAFNEVLANSLVPILTALSIEAIDSGESKPQALADEEKFLRNKKKSIFSECICILESLEGLLRTTNPLVMEESTRGALFSLILEKLCPILYMIGNHDVTAGGMLRTQVSSGETLARSVFSSWALFGGKPALRNGVLCKNSEKFLSSAFATYDRVDQGFDFIGHVHPARIRREAIELLIFGADDEHLRWDVMSPFELTQFHNELHSELVLNVLLPRVMEVLDLRRVSQNTVFLKNATKFYCTDKEPDCVNFSFILNRIEFLPQNSACTILSFPEIQDTESAGVTLRRRGLKDEIHLKRQGVKILGLLFKSIIKERLYLCLIVKALAFIAADDCLEGLRCLDGIDLRASNMQIESLFTCSVVSLQDASLELRLEAIYQLEKCLKMAFSGEYQIHWITPLLKHSLCSIALYYAQIYQELSSNISTKELSSSIFRDTKFVLLRLTLAAILPLARLRVTHDGRAVLVTKSSVLGLIPVSAMSFAFESNEIKDTKEDGCICDPNLKSSSFECKGVRIYENEHDSDSLLSDATSLDHSFATITTETELDDQCVIAPFLYICRNFQNSFVSQIVTEPWKRPDGEEYNLAGGCSGESDSSNPKSSIWTKDVTGIDRTTVSFHMLFSVLGSCLKLFSTKFQRNHEGEVESATKGDSTSIIDCEGNSTSIIDCDGKLESTVNRDDYLVSVLRTLCFATIEAMLYCGVALQYPDDREAIKSVSDIRESDLQFSHERVARSRALAAFSCSIIYSHANIVTPCKKWCRFRADLSTLILELVSSCCSSEHDVVPIGCRGLSFLLAVLYSRKHDCQEETLQLFQDICKTLIDRVEGLVIGVTSGNLSSSSNSRLVVPLLLVLYDIFSLLGKPEARNSSPYLVSYASRFVTNCYRICALRLFSRPVAITAMHCAAAAYPIIPTAEARRLFFSCKGDNVEFVGNDLDAESLWQGDEVRMAPFPRIILDFLARGYPSLDPHPRGTYFLNARDCHDVLLRESEDMETFQCAEHDASSWIANDGVLTCKKGKANCRGWVEVTYRTPVAHYRRLVRLTDFPTVDFPCILRPSDLSLRNHHAKQRVQNVSHVSTLPENYQIENSAPLQKAALLLREWDKYFLENELVNGFNTKCKIGEGIECLDANLLEEHLDGRNAPARRQSEGVNFMRAQYVASNNPNYTSRDYLIDDADDVKDLSVVQWLLESFNGNVNAVEEVVYQLKGFGFSHISLGHKMKGDNSVGVSMTYMGHDARVARAIKILDRTNTMQTHKIALLFIGQGSGCEMNAFDERQPNESIVLGARHGSPDFLHFRDGLGILVPTRELRVFSGGLDTSPAAADGEMALIWTSETPVSSTRIRGAAIGGTMVLYHDVTLMPPGLNKRKRHVGNDSVHIVYVEKGSSIGSCLRVVNNGRATPITDDSLTISGQFGFVTIFVVPLKGVDFVKVIVRVRDDSNVFLSNLAGTSVLPKDAASIYVRQMAIRADIACQALTEERVGLASNWEERLLQLRSMSRFKKI